MVYGGRSTLTTLALKSRNCFSGETPRHEREEEVGQIQTLKGTQAAIAGRKATQQPEQEGGTPLGAKTGPLLTARVEMEATAPQLQSTEHGPQLK